MNLKTFLLGCSRRQKQLVAFLADCVSLTLALWLSFALRLGEWYMPTPGVASLILAAPFIAAPVFVRLGLYRAVFRYIGFRALVAVARAVGLYALAWGVAVYLSGVPGVPRSVLILNALIALLLVGGSRMAARWWFSGQALPRADDLAAPRKRVALYGAGEAGVQLASALAFSREMQPVAFVDDNAALAGHQVAGLRVHAPLEIGDLIRRERVAEVLLAMPSAPRYRQKEILSALADYPVHVRALPGVAEIARGEVRMDDLREVGIEDLLGREPVPPQQALLRANVAGRAVLVTGAGGSIGSELCRQILALGPRVLVLYEQGEYALYAIDRELAARKDAAGAAAGGAPGGVVPVLGSVQDQPRLEQACRAWGIETIFHAAAYKHVPLVEHNPVEAVANNIFGTWRAAKAARNTGVSTFVLISTDKAVRPTNTMGASKRFAELILQGMQGEQEAGGPRFVMVRFGNVLGSSGSVVPLFREQIRNGGPVTVTHPDIVRYFMTIPEAAQLVIQAGAMGEGGDVFVLDMGEPVKIMDLARRMVRLSGLEVRDAAHPHGDIEIACTGLRPGEKLYEELLIGEDTRPTPHPRIMRANEAALTWNEVEGHLAALGEAHAAGDSARVRDILLAAVPEFAPQCDNADWLAGAGSRLG